MESSNPAKDPLAVATSPICRRWLSTDDDLVSVTSDEKVAYLLQQIFACTKVQKKLLAEFPSCLCSTCKSHLDSMDMYRSLCNLSNVKVELFEEETDTIHLTAEHCNNDQQTDDVESVWIKSKVAAESAEEDYQSSQTVSDSQQMNSTYGYNRKRLKAI
ncbi:uncharacterized protein LOC131206585 [Anopheles bellator]|uniref:uncharacterized protein LOC131206585 n=1 Tax=Anopheles bellator TaxID=139047 RepID=UPI00264986FC|nr:uncharacterized protein LOC131206585 [Anopheles bellator]